MALESILRTKLVSMSAVTDLVDPKLTDDPRIRPDAFDPNEDVPAVVVEVDDEEHLTSLVQSAGRVFAAVNIICRADERVVSRALAEAVKYNGTDPGTGLAGFSGTVDGTEIDCILESEATASTPKEKGSSERFYDTNLDFQISFAVQV